MTLTQEQLDAFHADGYLKYGQVLSADDLELLMKVLEANKGLFPRLERSATETIANATKTSAKADGSETDAFMMSDRETASSARVDRIANGILTP